VDVVREVHEFLAERAAFALKAGIAREALCIDPGIGFGKSTEHNLLLLRGVRNLTQLGFPVLVGHSRKRFLAELGGGEEPEQRVPAGLAAAALAIANGAAVLRTHDVAATVQAARVADAIVGKGPRMPGGR
jgi:dihydropteroate synthase